MGEKIIERNTIGRLNQKEFSCRVDKNLDFDYLLLYVQSIEKYLCWKKDLNRNIYNAQQKQVMDNQNDEISSFIKGKEFSSWGKEKVYIIDKNKINEFKNKLLKDEVDFI